MKAHEQKIRFLIAGVWNTTFGYFLFAFLYLNFSKWIHYLMILVITNIIGLTNAYICYKLFVFRTKGNVLREYSRFYLVYGTSIAINFILLPVLVELFHIHPLIAQASMIFFTVIVSYFGHKRFSFAIC